MVGNWKFAFRYSGNPANGRVGLDDALITNTIRHMLINQKCTSLGAFLQRRAILFNCVFGVFFCVGCRGDVGVRVWWGWTHARIAFPRDAISEAAEARR